MENWLATDAISDPAKALLIGLAVGLLFGAAAQSSKFCLRSACAEFWFGRMERAVAVWLLVFGSALLGAQLLLASGELKATEIRQLSDAGSLSGAIVGGMLFGVGMILARGCASRLLVLSATGNLRALVSGLLVTIVAQASLSGVLSPARLYLASLWTVSPQERSILTTLPLALQIGLGAATLLLAVAIAWRARLRWTDQVFALGVGGAVALGWYLTSALARVSFNPVSVGSVTFTGPSADTLMALITSPQIPLGFAIGLVPGVFLGSFASSLLRREFKLQAFSAETGTGRYMIGAGLMGFGGMLAGGCAVGAGITGGSVLSLTAWVALLFMWLGAGATLWAFELAGRDVADPQGQAAPGR